jgi:hypothetical protein
MFVPPKHNALVCRFTDAFLPAIGHFVGRIRDVHVAPEDLERLKELGPHRAILAPNHPTGMDPIVLLWLSRHLGQPFHYLAAREVLVGMKGWFLNQVGAYSVIRGIADRESLRATRKLLAEGDKKIVIFPEGEIYEHNDTLLAFQPGVAQIGFWSLDDMAKAKKEPNLPLVPVAFKYRCSEAPRPAIENALHGLEETLKLSAAGKMPAYQRLRRIGDVMMASVETDFGMKPDPERPLTERVQSFRKAFLERCARVIGTELDAGECPAEQLHHLFVSLREWVGELPDDANDYDRRRYERRVEQAEPLFGELQRFQNFIAVTGDYVAQNPTGERFLEVLGRLEKEVYGELRHTAISKDAVVRIAPPIRMEERYETYRGDKRGTVRQVTAELEGQIRGMLQELSAAGTPISLEF